MKKNMSAAFETGGGHAMREGYPLCRDASTTMKCLD